MSSESVPILKLSKKTRITGKITKYWNKRIKYLRKYVLAYLVRLFDSTIRGALFLLNMAYISSSKVGNSYIS